MLISCASAFQDRLGLRLHDKTNYSPSSFCQSDIIREVISPILDDTISSFNIENKVIFVIIVYDNLGQFGFLAVKMASVADTALNHHSLTHSPTACPDGVPLGQALGDAKASLPNHRRLRLPSARYLHPLGLAVHMAIRIPLTAVYDSLVLYRAVSYAARGAGTFM